MYGNGLWETPIQKYDDEGWYAIACEIYILCEIKTMHLFAGIKKHIIDENIAVCG